MLLPWIFSKAIEKSSEKIKDLLVRVVLPALHHQVITPLSINGRNDVMH